NKLHDVISVDAIKSMENMEMSSFELKLWKLLGRNFIQERDRAKDIAWDSDKTFMYHCHVDSDGSYKFKGPYLQPGQTHLQRNIGDENVLLVKFSGQMVENSGRNSIFRCNNSSSTYQPNRNEGVGNCDLNFVYHRIREEGILVGSRRYHFFAEIHSLFSLGLHEKSGCVGVCRIRMAALFAMKSGNRRSILMPLLIQLRLFHNGGAVKGTLLVNKKLPPNTIQVRPSMIKVRSDVGHVNDDPMTNSFEVVATRLGSVESGLSCGFPLTILIVIAASLYYGEMDDFLLTKMILCGIPLGEPYLKERLSVLMREDLKKLKEGKLPVNDSYSLMGTADPTGILQPDQVCVILENGQVSGDVLVYKHPGLHFGDVHLLTATYVKELKNYVGDAKYGIFFPIVGPRSIADEIANSDLDGDMYWVCRNTQLLSLFTPSTPWTQSYFAKNVSHLKPADFHVENELEHHLFEQYLTARFSSNPVGEAATYWLRLMARRLTMDKSDAEKINEVEGKLLQLTDIYYDALDAAKSGKKISRLMFFFC
ncbi:hypothetical protein C5167_044341, partial [Papaver somniferum]